MKRGDLIFVRSKTITGMLIRLVTKSWANHVAIYLGDNKIIESNPGGVKILPVKKYIKSFTKKMRYYRILVDDDVIENFVKKAESKKGYDYDYIQIISLLFLHLFKIKKVISGIELQKLTICSELVNDPAREAGIFFTNLPSSNITPGDIMDSDIVYEIKNELVK